MKLGEVCDLIKDGTHGTHKDYVNGIPLLSAKDVNYGQIFIPNDCRKISIEDFEKIHKNYSLQNNDVVLTIVGTIGRTGIIKNYNNSYTFQRSVAILRIKKTENYNYCFHYFNSRNFQLQLEQKTNSSAQGGIYLKSLSETILHLPPLPEQTRIAACLSVWDDGIETLKKLITAKKKLKKGLMQRLLSPKNPLAGFEGVEWRGVRLGEVCRITMGQSPSSSNYNSDGIGLPLVQGNADILNNKTISRIYTTEITKISNKGEIILTVRAPVGEVAYVVQDKICIGRGVSSINGVNVVNEFIFFYLINNVQKWKELEQGSTFSAINRNDIEDFEFLLPPLLIQQRIAAILSKADEEIELLEKKLNNFETQKKGLMQILLSGKVRFSEFIN